MQIQCVWEHNENDSLIYAANLPGAYTRGADKEIALRKMEQEVSSFLRWKGENVPKTISIKIIQDAVSTLNIRDADSDVLFVTETDPICYEEYAELKSLALKSASDFLTLYESIPDKNKSCIPIRKTFYGTVPRTAAEMYEHTKNVNQYYFGEIEVDANNEGTILECRRNGFETLESKSNFLQNEIFDGSYGERWTLRKMLRRFIWHDRIHGKAMYRMAINTFGAEIITNVFGFESDK